MTEVPREVGETLGAGFEIGVRRSVTASVDEVWEAIAGRPALWLGADAEVDLVKGASYAVPGGDGFPPARGEVRSVHPGDRIRLTWWPEGWEAPAVLQFALRETPSGKTAITGHMEKLRDGVVREEMRAHLRVVLGRLAEAVEG
ncbi:MAG: SRPBCC domain-containing protein [Thermoleophilia bacterium]